jgi:hypothetical protein
MAGLVIDHGNPWWLSPNVWVVPTSNPSEGSPGEIDPVVSQQYYAVANVRNTTSADILNATVYFWWANPSLGIITSTNANLIGTSSVSVGGNQTNTSLSLTPWVPSYVNNGHECIIAAVVEGGGQPPSVLNGDNDPTVAQHNLGVVQTGAQMQHRFHYPIQICNPSRVERTFRVQVRQAPLEEAKPFLPGRLAKEGKLRSHGFLKSACPEPAQYEGAPSVLESIKLAPLACTGVTLVGATDGGMVLLHVTQQVGDRIIGGLSVLIVSSKEHGHEHRA